MTAMKKRATKKLLPALIVASVLTGCAGPITDNPTPLADREELAFSAVLPAGAVVEEPHSEPASVPRVELVASPAPDARTPQERIPEIMARGRIVVGVDQSQNLMSFRNPRTGDQEGFEIDLAKALARDIFGNPDALELRFIDQSTQLAALQTGDIDMAMRSITITADRAQAVDFSAPYLTTTVQLLVDDASPITSFDSVGEATVCVADNTTTVEYARAMTPQARLLKVRLRSDCLVALQQGYTDVVMSDAVPLAGMANQDPHTRRVGANARIGVQYYGVAVRDGERDLTQQINASLARLIADGTWSSLYNRWLGDYLGPARPPVPLYGEEQP